MATYARAALANCASHTTTSGRGSHQFVGPTSISRSTRRGSIVVASTAAGGPRARRPTITDLKARIQELEMENKLLREELDASKYQSASISELLDVTERAVIEAPAHKMGKGLVTIQPASDIAAQLESGILWPSVDESPPFWQRSPRSLPLSLQNSDAEASDTSPKQPWPPSSLHIVHVTAEMAPVAKVGGLGDVVTGLAKACLVRNATVEVILPFYECLNPDGVQDLTLEREFDCPKGRVQDTDMHMGVLKTQAWTGSVDQCPVVLLRPDWEASGSPLFRGSKIYGGSYNETEAYLYFCRAALEYLRTSDRSPPDIIHAHEWQASAVPMLFWERFHESFPRTKPVLTIHNMDSSGECRQDEFAATGVSGALFATVEKALDERTIGHNPERLCLLKGGVVYASAVTTVSPTYATETLSGGAAGWLRSTLARPDVAAKYWGVLNGIDTESWNPASDPALPACFNAAHPEGKALCKRFLQRGLGLDEDPAKPMVAVVTRLVPQKGIHLIEHAASRCAALGAQFVLLGTGHADGGLRRMAGEQFRDHTDIHMEFTYSETLARMIYGAADMFLVPSMFEPCGLTQMIALRYGAVPIVRATGGLADTVRDVDASRESDETRPGAPAPNGFVFSGVDSASLDSALDRAVAMYNERPDEWAALCAASMADSDRWSWKQPAESYLQLYSGALAG